MQVEKHHRIQVQQLSVKRNQANAMKQKLLATKKGEFKIQHSDNKSQFQEKIHWDVQPFIKQKDLSLTIIFYLEPFLTQQENLWKFC